MITFNFRCDGGPGREGWCDKYLTEKTEQPVGWHVDWPTFRSLCPDHKPHDLERKP